MSISDTSIYSSLIEISRPMKRRKVLILGAPETGKSAILLRFKENVFLEVYEPTIQNSTKKFLPFRNEYVELDITDLDGQTEYTVYSPNKYSFGVNGYLLIYSVNNRASFELLKTINDKLNSIVGKKFPKVVIGNKSDLKEDREVSFEEGKKFADSLNCPFMESSAKNNINIQNGFLSLLIEINKIENNFDINTICCPTLFQHFIKNEKCSQYLCYFTFIMNIILSIATIVMGTYSAYICPNLTTDMRSFLPMVVGIWGLIFAVFGFMGLKNQKGDTMNIYIIGLIIGTLFTVTGIILYILYPPEKGEGIFAIYSSIIKIFELYVSPVVIVFNLIALSFSLIYKKIFDQDLLSYII